MAQRISVGGSITVSRATPRQAARDVGPVIYAFRMEEGVIKIGYSESIYSRLCHLGPLSNLLALVPGSHEDEQRIHEDLKAHRNRGIEYYNATPEVVAFVNEMRTHTKQPPIAA